MEETVETYKKFKDAQEAIECKSKEFS